MSNEYQQPRDDYRDSGSGGGGRGRGPGGGGFRGGPRRDDRGGERGGDRGGDRRGVPLSELDPTTTEASRKVIGAAIEVHRALGPGFPREVYANALKRELDDLGVKHESGHAVPVRYKDREIGSVTADMWVEGRFIVTVSATCGPVSTAERMALRAQLKAADFELGLIVNFGERRLKDGLVRVVNIDKIRAEKGLGDEYEDDHTSTGGDFDNPA